MCDRLLFSCPVCCLRELAPLGSGAGVSSPPTLLVPSARNQERSTQQTALSRGRQLAGDFPNEAIRRQSLLLWGVVSLYCSLQNQFSKAQLHRLFAFVTVEPGHPSRVFSCLRAPTPAREREMSLCERQPEPLAPHTLPLIQTESCEGLRRPADLAWVREDAAVNLKLEV